MALEDRGCICKYCWKCEAMILNQKRVECTFWVREELLSQVEEIKYLGILFTSVRQKWSRRLTDRLVQHQQWYEHCGKERTERVSESVYLPVHLHSRLYLQPQAESTNWKNNITYTNGENGFPLRSVWPQACRLGEGLCHSGGTQARAATLQHRK